MAHAGKFTQTPTEVKRYSIDYDDWLDTGETISALTFDCLPAETPPLVAGTVEIAPGARSAVFFVSGGVAGSTYTAAATMVSSGGQTKTDTILFTVKPLV